MTTDQDRLRAWVRSVFGTEADEDTGGSQSNQFAREGANPAAAISDEARMRDYVRRMFHPEFAASEQELPE